MESFSFRDGRAESAVADQMESFCDGRMELFRDGGMDPIRGCGRNTFTNGEMEPIMREQTIRDRSEIRTGDRRENKKGDGR